MDENDSRRLDALAKSTGRSPSLLAGDALRAFLEVQEWQTAGVIAAVQSLEENGGVAHADVRSWVQSWDHNAENKRPEPNGR